MIGGNWRVSGACSFILACTVVTPNLRAQPELAPEPEVRAYRFATVGGGGSFLGVGIKEIDAARAKELKLREEAGVEITRVEEESPAAKAGLKVGDAVLQFNGQRVEGMEQFSRFVRETPPGRDVRLTVSRDGNTQTITAKVEARKAPTAWNFEVPRVEPMIPDMPHNLMMWRSSMLGIEAEPLRGQLADYFGVKQGVLVRSVTKDSAAEKAGLKAGDVILRVNDTKVASPGEITGALRSLEGKNSVTIGLIRDRKEITVSATVEDGSNDWRGPRVAPRQRAVKM